jgi:hypothetical protein
MVDACVERSKHAPRFQGWVVVYRTGPFRTGLLNLNHCASTFPVVTSASSSDPGPLALTRERVEVRLTVRLVVRLRALDYHKVGQHISLPESASTI